MLRPLRPSLRTLSLCASAFAAILSAAGCSSDDDAASGGAGDEVTNLTGDAPLSDRDSLFEGAPDNGKLPEEGKADAVYPAQLAELVPLQSPVRSQARRGVCSIFATVALMEHLYVKEGQITNPDFSEQYLQWSAKFEAKKYQSTEGSSAEANLTAINKFGIVQEGDWAYEASPWTTANDATCTGEKQPTICYTNGSPPEKAVNAKKWHLPAGRWINSSEASIKGFMSSKKQAATVGLTFFYQAWNHRSSALTTNNDYWRKGYVTYPSDEDKTESAKHAAGHAVLLVGWDDTIVVQKRDGKGKLLTKADGTPDTEKGFFIFKNSWGTGSFGVNNPYGDGYGLISFKYVKEYGTVYVSDVPEVVLPEVCNDGVDNDKNGKLDCSDSACQADTACVGAKGVYASTVGKDIPDADANGITSDIVVPDGGAISALSVTVDITHPYQGDLTVKLVRKGGGGEVTLWNKQGGGQDNLQKTFSVADFNGKDAAGTWSLVVSDADKQDVGRLNGWSMEIAKAGASTTSLDENTTATPIPDNSPTGAFTNVEVAESGAIKSMKVVVDITHAYKGDVTIKLQRLGVPGEVVLVKADASSGPFEKATFLVADWVAEDAKGTYRLTAIDEAAQDAGTLNGWSLEITR